MTLHLKTRYFNITIRNKWKCLFLFHDWFPLNFFFDVVNIFLMWWKIKSNLNSKYILELAKRRSKVQEKNMWWKRALSFDQWKRFSESYKPMRVWLWLLYKLTKNYCCLRLFPSSFKQGILPLMTKDES